MRKRDINPSSDIPKSTRIIIRSFDIIISLFGLILTSPLLVLLIMLCWLDTGAPIFRQGRVGKGQKTFTLIKLRTMKPNTTSVATHLADPNQITLLGSFLRRSKLDELPQLWNVLKGEMSLVGPRPCLPNQIKLIREREKRGVFSGKPGITGLAQITGIDMSTPKLLAKVDEKLVNTLTISSYFYYLFLTITGKGSGDRASTARNKEI